MWFGSCGRSLAHRTSGNPISDTFLGFLQSFTVPQTTGVWNKIACRVLPLQSSTPNRHGKYLNSCDTLATSPPIQSHLFGLGHLFTGRRVEAIKQFDRRSSSKLIVLCFCCTRLAEQKLLAIRTEPPTLFTAAGPITFRYVNRKPNDGLTMAIYTANEYKAFAVRPPALCPHSSPRPLSIGTKSISMATSCHRVLGVY